MYRNKRFTARLSPEDKNLLVHLAAYLRRTKSDTVRILIYEKAVELGIYPHAANQRQIGVRKQRRFS
jgi:predicted DNA-binding protein